MKRNIRVAGMLLGVFTVTALIQTPLRAEPKVEKSADNQVSQGSSIIPLMHSNLETLLKLQEYVADTKKFSDPKNSDSIKTLIDQLAKVSHTLPETMKDNKKEGLAAISYLFSDYFNDIQNNYEKGSKIFARNQIMTATGFCMSCHTSMESKKSFSDMQKRVQTLPLNDEDKAEFLSATRQFDDALNIYKKLLKNPIEDKAHAFAYLKKALGITVRVKQNPSLTLDFIELGLGQKMPDFFAKTVGHWKADAQAWADEKSMKVNQLPSSSLQLASTLVDSALDVKKVPGDSAPYVTYMRAINHLNQALSKDLTPTQQALAFYLMGISYGAIEDPLLWDLDEYYYQACIEKLPHTKQSAQCYNFLKAKVYYGYTGSGGVFIPEDTRKKLNELKKKAF